MRQDEISTAGGDKVAVTNEVCQSTLHSRLHLLHHELTGELDGGNGSLDGNERPDWQQSFWVIVRCFDVFARTQ